MLTLDEYERRLGGYEFERHDYRRSSRRRELEPGCGHVIDAGEPYRYGVAKVFEVPGLIQTYACDVCMRADHRY